MSGNSEYSDRDLLVQLIERVDGLIKQHDQDKEQLGTVMTRLDALEKKESERDGKVKLSRTMMAIAALLIAGLEILILLK